MAEHEMIDLLNEKGKTIGVVDKAVAHRDGLWHKSVHVWMLNEKNEILMQKRCADKKFFPNHWDVSFAGHVGTGESSSLTAVREGEEELGITLKENDLNFLFTIKEKFKWNNIQSNEFVDVYLMKTNLKIQNFLYQKEEVEKAKYFTLQEFFENINNKDVFPHLEEYELLKEHFIKNMGLSIYPQN